jgi:cytochrome c-type biogenesis protein CcmF
MLKKWNILLLLLAFNLAILGTLVVRGGLLSSVHNFAKSSVGPAFLAFLGVTITGSVLLFTLRAPALKSSQQFESLTSKESSFLYNNLLLAGAAFATFWGTIFPLITEAFDGSRITVGPPFYNKVNGPIFLGVLVLMGIGPLLAWRRTSWEAIKRNFRWPLAAALLWVGVMVGVLRITNGWTLLGVGACAFAFGTIVLEYWRGVRARRLATGEAYPAALTAMVGRNRRRYGGYLVHVAVLLIALGSIGWNFHRVEGQITLRKGESAEVGGYTFTYQGTQTIATADSTVDLALLEARQGGQAVSVLKPRIETFRNFESQPSSHVAIRTSPVEDIYVFLAAWDENVATFVVFINPLVVWIWVGGVVFLAGTLLAFWPQGQRNAVPAPAPVTEARNAVA